MAGVVSSGTLDPVCLFTVHSYIIRVLGSNVNKGFTRHSLNKHVKGVRGLSTYCYDSQQVQKYKKVLNILSYFQHDFLGQALIFYKLAPDKTVNQHLGISLNCFGC